MALYRIGTAAMDAQGVITGTGTKWREPLSLIRTGATIVFLEQPVIQLAVISEIVSDTEMKAISTDGAVVPDGKYVILLNDSLTVDGMAQDVAETLRYYQSKETVIEEAIEFFKNFDLQSLVDLVNQIKDDAAKVAADRAATEKLKNETNQIKSDTNTIKNQTQQIKDSAVTEVTGIKNEALDARDEAESAQLAAEQSKIGADSAKVGAETARDEARQWAQQVNPENLLHKDQNLADLPNKETAKAELGLERFAQGSTSTTMKISDYTFSLDNNGVWGVTKKGIPGWITLGVAQGGTGRGDGSAEFNRLDISRSSRPQLHIYATGRSDVGAALRIEVPPELNTSPYFTQIISPSDTTGAILNFLPRTSGTIAVQGTSGREYKKDIKLADSNEALSRVTSLEMVNFVYKDDENQRVRFGVIAEDAEKIAPQYVKHNQFPIPGTEIFDDEGNKIGEEYQDRPSIDVNPIVMDLLGCVQAQQKQIDELKTTIAEMQTMFVQLAK